MSNNPPGVPSRSASIANGPPSAGVNGPASNAQAPPTPGGPASQQNLNQIVLEYLSKKGYSKTESTLRKESATHDANGVPVVTRAEDLGGAKYDKSYTLLQRFINDTLEIYRPELTRFLWPIFVHSILDLAADFYPRDCEAFYEKHHKRFERDHASDLYELKVIKLPEHGGARIAKLYRASKYRLSITKMAYSLLLQFMEAHENDGGSVIMYMISHHIHLVTLDRAVMGNERSLAAMTARQGEEWDGPAEDEGIPGHNPGSANTDPNAPKVLAKLALGPLPMDLEAMEDVRDELQEEDAKNPPSPGEKPLAEVFEQMIKREPNEDAPSREQVPLPPPLARDVAMEIQKVREHRDRFKIDPRSGGVAPGISVCMYTFHNTYDSINCLDFSGDLLLVAAGTKHSYIQVWSLDGKPLTAFGDDEKIHPEKPSSSRRLIGHSGPVYAVAFSPSTARPSPDAPETNPRYLLSSSADKTVRLWSVDAWACLTMYRAHNAPVWDVCWGPSGHYFLTCGHDKVARVWATEHISPLRMFVGHDDDVDCGCFHPNGAYVFTAGDRTVRMWDIARGTAVRMFTGHTGNITSMECSPDGKTLASADDQGSIFLWDLTVGTLIKRMRGHGKGGIWSLSWSVESRIVVSGGADMSVRVWDAAQKPAEKSADGALKLDPATGASAVVGVSGGAAQKKSKKDVVVTPDQISVFPTKKSPVYKVYFSRSNLVLSGAAYMPDLH